MVTNQSRLWGESVEEGGESDTIISSGTSRCYLDCGLYLIKLKYWKSQDPVTGGWQGPAWSWHDQSLPPPSSCSWRTPRIRILDEPWLNNEVLVSRSIPSCDVCHYNITGILGDILIILVIAPLLGHNTTDGSVNGADICWQEVKKRSHLETLYKRSL